VKPIRLWQPLQKERGRGLSCDISRVISTVTFRFLPFKTIEESAATLQGWGGPKLLQSYETERRPIGAINVKASGGGTAGRMKWRAAYRPDIEDDTASGRAALAELLTIARAEAPKSFRVIGAELGYRYAGSQSCLALR
jgi:hypothetical protein